MVVQLVLVHENIDQIVVRLRVCRVDYVLEFACFLLVQHALDRRYDLWQLQLCALVAYNSQKIYRFANNQYLQCQCQCTDIRDNFLELKKTGQKIQVLLTLSACFWFKNDGICSSIGKYFSRHRRSFSTVLLHPTKNLKNNQIYKLKSHG